MLSAGGQSADPRAPLVAGGGGGESGKGERQLRSDGLETLCTEAESRAPQLCPPW